MPKNVKPEILSAKADKQSGSVSLMEADDVRYLDQRKGLSTPGHQVVYYPDWLECPQFLSFERNQSTGENKVNSSQKVGFCHR